MLNTAYRRNSVRRAASAALCHVHAPCIYMQAEQAHMAELRRDLDHVAANRSDLERERAAMVQEDRESRFVRDRLHDWDEIAAIIAAGSDSDND